jgi:hypothetical protein
MAPGSLVAHRLPQRQKARNMHKHIRAKQITGTGGKDKTMVVGVVEGGGVVRTTSEAKTAPVARERARRTRPRITVGRDCKRKLQC